jgi:hypothetical protein
VATRQSDFRTSILAAPNSGFPVLLGGLRRMLLTLYDPCRFYERVLDSLELWQVRPEQKAPALSFLYQLRVLFKSVWRQGVMSGYRRDYWRFLGRLMRAAD